MAMGLTAFITALFVSADRKFERLRCVLSALHFETVRCARARARVDEREGKNQPEEKTRGGHGGERDHSDETNNCKCNRICNMIRTWNVKHANATPS